MWLLAWLITLAMGAMWVWALKPWPMRSMAGVVLALAMALLVGCLGAALASMAHLVVARPMRWPQAGVDVVALLLMLLGAWVVGRSRQSSGDGSLSMETGPGWLRWGAPVWGGLVSLGAAGVVVVNLARQPWGGWDAIMIWNLRPRFFLRAGDQWLAAFDPLLPHTDYPLLLPLLILRLWRYMGAESALASQSVSFLFTAAAAMTLWATLRICRGSLLAWLGLLALLANPFFLLFGSWQLADVPLAVFLLAGWAMVMLALRQAGQAGSAGPGVGCWVLAGAMFGGMILTKNEGLMLLGVSVVMLVIVARPGLWWLTAQGRGAFLAMLAGLLPLVLGLVVCKMTLAGSNDLFRGQTSAGDAMGRLIDPSRHAQILAAYWHFMTHNPPVWVTLFLPVVAAVTGWRLRGDRRLMLALIGVIVMALAGYYLVYLLTPHDLEWHVRTSMSRLLTHVWPLFVLVVMLGMDWPRGRQENIPNQAVQKI